ncbi:DUF3168 domain-containing protein [Stappia sp. F7233]|uniref:DUF3168 domain-containing protein n=1 Tax=Stappia albiluteola TaxID=2758565 RepID=A0A839AK27_9HYPH|nr:DUF3168 domain-containing protein [Stappia albiluteola]MBA5779495.1 DUF3168 domain-containing protein [Stappia albiluteola]
MTAYAWPLQQALYAALTDPPLDGVTRVVDHSFADAGNGDFPFVQIGEAQSLPNDVQCSTGSDEYIDLHVWSRYRGQREVKEIMGAIHAALHQSTLAVDGLSSCFAYVDGQRVFTDPDGLTRHGVVTLKITCHI